jgi:CxxC-x17-CxxC domain-containing protein
MRQETQKCQNCKQKFTIEAEDFQFYEKLKVPPPTFCPTCRFQRRLLFWNPITLYQRPCDLCKKFNISVFPPEAPYTVYCPMCWWGDGWDSGKYAREYDFSRSFFEQINELWHEVPLEGLSIDLQTAQNSPYNHDGGYLKNCYLLFNALECQDSAYGYYLGHSQSMFNCTAVEQCQFGYDSMHSYKTNRCIGSRHQLSESFDCLFCRDTQNSQNCFASANLKNKKYCAWNKQLTREEYIKEVGRYDLGSYAAYRKLQEKAEAHWKTQIPKSEYSEFVTNCTGPNIFFSKNAKDCIEVYNAEDCRYLFRMFGPLNKDCYDISMWGMNLSRSYESMVVGENSTELRFCNESGINLTDAEYCRLSTGGSHHFGCVSIKKGDYCILNKRYEKDAYEKMTARIRAHMDEMPYTDARGNIYRYGEFFPPELSPFAYNTTLAQNLFPLTKEGAEEKQYPWRDPEHEAYKTTISAQDIPDHIKDVSDAILKEKIVCLRCGRAYRIIEMELQFHRQMNVPLPRECPFCRINEKMNLWVKNNERNKRVCAGCGVEMESPYREEEYREVYCRKCYLERI